MIVHDFEVWQDGGMVAGASSAIRSDALREANRYAAVYSRDMDAPAVVMEVSRWEITKTGKRKVPEGQALVPMEPTAEMVIAGVKAVNEDGGVDLGRVDYSDVRAAFKAMVADGEAK